MTDYDESKASPRPWELREQPAMDGKGRRDILSAKRTNVPFNRDDEAHIVHCVNAHDTLTAKAEMLERVVEALSQEVCSHCCYRLNQIPCGPCISCGHFKNRQLIAEAKELLNKETRPALEAGTTLEELLLQLEYWAEQENDRATLQSILSDLRQAFVKLAALLDNVKTILKGDSDGR